MVTVVMMVMIKVSDAMGQKSLLWDVEKVTFCSSVAWSAQDKAPFLSLTKPTIGRF